MRQVVKPGGGGAWPVAVSSACSSVSKRWTVDTALVITRVMDKTLGSRGAVMVGLWAMLAACDGPARPPSAEAQPAAATPKVEATPKAEATAPAEGPAKEGEERRFTGVLRYTEIKPVKSVESYLGREYTLTTSGDGALNIKASAAVSDEQLRALDGKTITVRGRYHPEKLPPNDVQAPMGSDGPMPWPAYYEVLELVPGAANP